MPYIGKSPSAGVRQRYQYTATAGQTTFSGTDLGNLTLTYTDNNFVDVFQNGVLLKGGGNDYTATSGTSVVLATGATADDVIEIIVYDVFSVGNFFNRTDSDSRYVNVDGDTMTGNLGIGVAPTTSYGRVTQIHDTGTDGANLRLTDANSGSGTGNGFEIIQQGSNNFLINRESGYISIYNNGSERMKIESDGDITISDGDLVIGTSGHGIDFSATSDASGQSSEVLDDYEEGTWTPLLAYATGGTTGIAYTTQIGRYTKVGRIVSIYFRIVLSNKGSGSGNASLSGLPFPVANVTQYPAAYGLHHDVNSGSGNSVANVLPIAQLFNNTSGLFWYNADSTTAINEAYFNNNSTLNGNVVYETS